MREGGGLVFPPSFHSGEGAGNPGSAYIAHSELVTHERTMKITTTIDDLIAVYGPKIKELPLNKYRDPGERQLLRALGDPSVAGESDAQTRSAGERRRPPKG